METYKKLIRFLNNKFSNNLNIAFLGVAISIILFLFIICFISYLGFIFHLSIQKSYIFVGLLSSIFFLYLFNKKNLLSYKELYVEIFVLSLIFIVAALLSWNLWDNSWDGRAFHQETIILLANSWNPIGAKPHSDLFTPIIWVEHYPKCAEILSANFVKLFDNIEIGKIINYLFASSSFLLSFFTFNKFKSSKILLNILLAILVVLNPISIGQIRTYYIDLLVYYLFVDILLTIVLKEKCIIGNMSFIFLASTLVAMLCNLKLGGIFYSIVLISCYLGYSIILKKRNSTKNIALITVLSSILILISGINPYYTNIKQGLHPFYPLAGKDKIDIITFNSPKSFKNKNSLYKLFISTFSSTSNIAENSSITPKLKVPFSLINQDWKYKEDMRIGGFGYFWSGILLLLIPFVIFAKNNKDENNEIYYFSIITIWLSVLLNPVAWWARYAPQFWLIPIFIIFWKSLNNNQSEKLKIFSFILIALLFTNSLILEVKNITFSIGFSFSRHRFFDKIKNAKIDFYISPDVEENTIYYKIYKNNTITRKIPYEAYLKNKDKFKTIPCLLLLDNTSIGVYKINE